MAESHDSPVNSTPRSELVFSSHDESSNNEDDVDSCDYLTSKFDEGSENKRKTSSSFNTSKKLRKVKTSEYLLAKYKNFRNFLYTKYNTRNVNTVSEGRTVLMRAILNKKFHHIDLLIKNGADVNYETSGKTALLCAVNESKTPSSVIQQLINAKADVNVINYLDAETPLIFLIRKFGNTQDDVKKVKLLLKAGADVNARSSFGYTALLRAVALPLNKNVVDMIKCLIDGGAILNGNPISPLNELVKAFFRHNKYSKEEADFLMLVIDMLITAGDNIFKTDSEDMSPICRLLKRYDDYCAKQLNPVIQHVIRTQFQLLEDGHAFDPDTEIHPLHSLLDMCYTQFLFTPENLTFFADLLLKYPEYKRFPPFKALLFPTVYFDCNNFKRFMNNVGLSIVGLFVLKAPITELKEMLLKFKEKGFSFNSGCSLLVILTIRVLHLEPLDVDTDTNQLTDIIDCLIESGCPVYSHKLSFGDNDIQSLHNTMRVPDCIWIAAAFGSVTCLKSFLPFWKQQPLAILLLLNPWKENFEVRLMMLRSIKTILPLLLAMGGQIPHSSGLFPFIVNYAKQCNLLETARYDPPYMENRTPINDLQVAEAASIYGHISRTLKEMNIDSPTSLQVLCRYTIRESLPEHGNNLPMVLSDMVPPKLKLFNSFREDVVITDE